MTDHSPDTPVIRIRNLHKSYGTLDVLKGVDLTAPRGHVVSLIGSSGSGKSTIANLVEKQLHALGRAAAVIDEMWFALLSPDEGRPFFRDKAMLYDQVMANAKLQGAGSPYPSMPHAPSTYGDYLQQVGPVKYNTSYLRVVGGTTWHFGSSLWRMLPNDFRLKSLYGRGRDWPIGYDELEPYYARAELELGVSGVDGQDESGQGGEAYPPRSIPYPMEGLKPSYMFRRLSELLGKGGYNPILEPNGRATRPYGKRPPCAGNNNCNPVCPIAAKYDILYIQGSIAVWAWYSARMMIGFLVVLLTSSAIEFLHQFTNNAWGHSYNDAGDQFGGTANGVEDQRDGHRQFGQRGEDAPGAARSP